MKKHLLLPLLTGLLLLNCSLTAQPDRQLFEDIDAFVEQARQDWQVPGVAVGIVRGNEIVHLNGYGLADTEAQRPVDENTLFAIGSSTKAITAFSVLQLVDDGQLDLDQPVLDYLPDFRMHDDYVTHHLSVRDLLCHRSGLPRHDAVWYGSTDSRAELFEKLKYLEPSAGFRETFQYQNLMFMAAGYLVGQTTGARWEEAVQKRIFEPLEMKRANFSVEQMAKDPNHAKPYTLEEEESKVMDFRNIDAIGPAGSVNASAREMCHWLIAQINGGQYQGKEVLSPGLLTVSHSAHMPVPAAWDRIMASDNGGGPSTYGLGWFISTHKGRKAIHHGGNIDGFSAMVGLLPQDSIGVVVLTNLNGNMLPSIIRNYVFDKMLGEEARDWNQELLAMFAQMKEQQQGQAEEEDLKQVQGTQLSHELDDYAGTYYHPAYGSVKISRAGDTLQLSYHAFEFDLRHYHYDVFAGEGPMFGQVKIAFHTNIDGDIDRLSSQMEPALEDAIYFERQAAPKSFSAEELQAFTGEYLVMGVQRLTVSQQDGQLQLSVPGQPTYTLVHHKGLEFKLKGLEGYKALFEQDDAGDIQAVVMLQPNGQFRGERQ